LEAFFVFVLDLIESTIKRRIALVENPALILRGIADSEPLLPAGIEVKLHCLNWYHLPTQVKIQSMVVL
jgi:phage tail protein X